MNSDCAMYPTNRQGHERLRFQQFGARRLELRSMMPDKYDKESLVLRRWAAATCAQKNNSSGWAPATAANPGWKNDSTCWVPVQIRAITAISLGLVHWLAQPQTQL